MRGTAVSLQIAILMAVILTIAVALASYLYTTLQASLHYMYIAVTYAYVYPKGNGSEVKICFTTGGSGVLEVVGVELNGRWAAEVKTYVHGVERGAVAAGEIGYIKAYFPGLSVQPGELPVGRLATRQGFSFFFTPAVVDREGVCPGG
ncbi:hypothetical protein [Pyrobaculum neutrophilum]|uniref:Archaeal Type IV pilin N-terminal domain-containing protein n=1 Tax=Pyrobaculum neutrophilum (strain DSM 2338 / JCM 9278 / NBRC 100436 / V24Sta) TaxID=444157 RepID=B1YAN6_PYRNV|nr:hypothetical protein [Pyrobaculum neutrophilum]ACB39115.1 conserved hypothetical protein [Pyrobaculum neutrophilum V24Sta]